MQVSKQEHKISKQKPLMPLKIVEQTDDKISVGDVRKTQKDDPTLKRHWASANERK